MQQLSYKKQTATSADNTESRFVMNHHLGLYDFYFNPMFQNSTETMKQYSF